MIAGTETFGCIFDHRNLIFIGNGHDFINLGRHTIQIDRHDSLRLLARLRDAVLDSLFQQLRVHVPCFRFRIHHHWRSTQIRYRMCRSAERETLHQHLVTRPYATRQQSQMNRRRSRAQSHHGPTTSPSLKGRELHGCVFDFRNGTIKISNNFFILKAQFCIS